MSLRERLGNINSMSLLGLIFNIQNDPKKRTAENPGQAATTNPSAQNVTQPSQPPVNPNQPAQPTQPTQPPQQPQPQQPPTQQPPPIPPPQQPLPPQTPPQPIPPKYPQPGPPPYGQPVWPPQMRQQPMPIPSQQLQRGQLITQPTQQPFKPLQNQDPYCYPGQVQQVEEPVETPEHVVTPETETIVEDSTDKAPMFGSDEVVEYVDTSEKVVEAPDVKESTLDLEAAHSVGFNDEKDDKPSEEAVFKDDDEIVFERKEKTIWKPPDAED